MLPIHNSIVHVSVCLSKDRQGVRPFLFNRHVSLTLMVLCEFPLSVGGLKQIMKVNVSVAKKGLHAVNGMEVINYANREVVLIQVPGNILTHKTFVSVNEEERALCNLLIST